MTERILRPAIFAPFQEFLTAGVTTRALATPGEDRLSGAARLPEILGLPEARVLVGEQIHGDGVFWADHESLSHIGSEKGHSRLGVAPGVDALATFRAGWILAIFTADCVPLLMADPVRRVIGAAHAGREGTLRGVGRLCLAAMLDHGAKADAVRAHIGPSICASHYEVGAEMAVDFRKRFGHYEGAVKGPERRHLNLPLINRLELLEAGVRPEHIEIEARCTVEHPDLFCSHRRDGLAAGRMISFLALQAGK